MNERSRNLRVGLFVLGAILLLVGGLFALGLREALEPRIRLETAVAGDVQGLTVGSAVEIRGIRVGQVTSIAFTWSDYPATRTDLALVRFDVKRALLPVDADPKRSERLHAEIERGLRVRLRSQALTGTSILSIERVDPKANPLPPIDYTPRDAYLPSAAPQLTRMLEAIERTLETLKEIRVQPILDRVDGVLASLETLGRQLEEIQLGRIEAKANSVADELVAASRDLHEGMTSAKEQIQALRLEESSVRIRSLLDQLTAAAGQLRTTLERAEGVDVDGLNEAITGLRRATDGLDQTLQEVRDYPAGALLGKPPKRPASVEDKR